SMPTAIPSSMRACSTCSLAPARSGLRRSRAARVLYCSSTTRRRDVRFCAKTSRPSRLARSPRFSAATRRNSATCIPMNRSRSSSAIRPIAKAWPNWRSPARVTAAGSRPARSSWSRKRRMRSSQRRTDSKNLNGAVMTIRNLSFCARCDAPFPLIPAQAGIQGWIPAFAGTSANRLTPSEQLLDVFKLQFHISRPPVIALARVLGGFHLTQKRIHFLGLQATAGANRAMARHGRRDRKQAPFERQRLVPFGHVFGEVAHQCAGVGIPQKRRHFAHEDGARPEGFDRKAKTSQLLGALDESCGVSLI